MYIRRPYFKKISFHINRMRTLTTILLFAAMYFIMSGYYEEKIEKLKNKKKTKPEYVPAPSYDMMLEESNKLLGEEVKVNMNT